MLFSANLFVVVISCAILQQQYNTMQQKNSTFKKRCCFHLSCFCYLSFAFQILCRLSSSALLTGGISICSIRSIDASNITICSLIVPWQPP